MSPVALGIEIAEIEAFLQTEFDRGDRARDFSGHKGFAPHRPFMIEQDAVRGMHAVGLAVVDRDPVGVKLGGAHKASGDKMASSRAAVSPAPSRRAPRSTPDRIGVLLEPKNADRLKKPQRAKRVGIGGVFRRLKAHLHMALRREIVDLGWAVSCMMRMRFVASVMSP